MASKFFREALSDRKPETKIFVKKSLDLLERIHELMTERGMTQKDLAEALTQKPSAVSRLLGSDEQNMTLKTIAKLEAVFGQDIIEIKGRENYRSKHFKMQTNKIVHKMEIVHLNNKPSSRPKFTPINRDSMGDNQPMAKAI